ncbi:MAG: metallophosphoesterase [Patescibacteria group bacterium]|jgi:hypothetical protein
MMTAIIILTLFSLVLFGGHFFVGFSFIKFFGISSDSHQIFVYAALFILSISFIALSAILHWKNGAFLNSLYYISAFWIGLALYLFLAVILGWLVIFASRQAGVGINTFALGTILTVLSLVIAIYGAWNATDLKLKTISVEIPGLPAEWKGKTAIQISDTHLGAINGAAFLEKIVKIANEQKPDLIFITGDLFDGSTRNFDELAKPLNGLHAPWGIYFVTGNHESYSGLSQVEEALSKTPVKILNDESVEVSGVQLIGIAYPAEGLIKEMAPIFASLKNSGPSILLYHDPMPRYLGEIKKAGVSLMLSGHTHGGQVFPANIITRLIYKGMDYGLRKDGNFSLYTSSGAGTWGPPLRIFTQAEIVKIIFD